MEDLFSVKLPEDEVARARKISRRLVLLPFLICLTIPISLIVSLILRGRISSFNTIVDSYLMPALHSASPDLWRFINYGFTTSMRYSAEYLLVGWATSVVLGIIAAVIALSAIRQMDLNYFIFNAQERNRRIQGLGYELLPLLAGLALAGLFLFIAHEGDFVAYSQKKRSKWHLIYIIIPIAYPTVILFLLLSAVHAKKIYILVKRRLQGTT